MRLVLVGTSHQHAPVELRERVALDHEQAGELARRLGEAVCLSTCSGSCAPSSRPVTNAAFIGHTSSRCDRDNSEKMQLRIVQSPGACTCGS